MAIASTPGDDVAPNASLLPEEEAKAFEELSKKLVSQRWRINNLYHAVDARGNDFLFKMNYAQKLLFLGLWFCNIILKSRQHGITTFICLLYLDICLFNSNTHACVIAHNKDDANDFFRKKILYAYNALPALLKAQIGAVQEASGVLAFTNGSSIRVTTSGRSGTYQLVHISELGKMCAKYPLKAEEVISGTLNAVHEGQIVTIESTAEGQEGYFFDMVQRAIKAQQQGKTLGKMEYKFFFFGWDDNDLNRTEPVGVEIYPRVKDYLDAHALKTNRILTPEQRAWYSQKEAVQGDLMFREHPSTPEEAFKSALDGAYYWRQFTWLRSNGRICKVPYKEGILVNTWWDLGFNDENCIWFTQDIGREVHVIHYYENTCEGLIHYKNYLDELGKSHGYKYGFHMAPHDIMVHEYTTGITRQDMAVDMGLVFQRGPKVSIQTQIEKARQFLSLCWFDQEECELGIRALESYKKEWNPKLGVYRNNPLHDWASHGSSAFALMSMTHQFSGNVMSIMEGVARDVKAAGEIIQVNKPRLVGMDPGGWT